MKNTLKASLSPAKSVLELERLRSRLAASEGALQAIRKGDVDTIVVDGKTGPQVFTLYGAEHAYRMLIESMNEGALTLTEDKMILYANKCFARMVKCPLHQVTGNSIRRFLSPEDQAFLRPLMKRATKAGSKLQVQLHVCDGTEIPVQISIRKMARNGFRRVTIGMVVTDMTEVKRTEELLRALTHRVVQVQEDERGRVALELHDNITQLLCAVQFRSQTLVKTLSAIKGPSKKAAVQLQKMLGTATEEVERISRELRPNLLEQMGLVPAMRTAGREFQQRTGIGVGLACVQLINRMPVDTELTLYRILQEALKNVEMHAHAKQVTVDLTQTGSLVQLSVRDDGVGYRPRLRSAGPNGKGNLGLLNMQERANYVGGTFAIHSARNLGTTIQVSIPLPAA